MQEKVLRKDQWIKPPMTYTEWMTAVNTGYRREYLNAVGDAQDHAVSNHIKDKYGSMASTIGSCLAEFGACKVNDVYPDLQNQKKLPYDLIVDHTRWDKYTGENYTRPIKIDVKTPARKDSKWVCVAEKYERKYCELYVFIYSKIPGLVFRKEPDYFKNVNGKKVMVPHLLVNLSTNKWNDRVHGCYCLGWQRGDYIFRPENKRRKPNSEKGFFITKDELLDTMEDCIP
jgi:hypothetical protein